MYDKERSFRITIYYSNHVDRLSMRSKLEPDTIHELASKLFEQTPDVVAVSTETIKGSDEIYVSKL